MASIIILGDPHIGKGVLIGKAGMGANLNSRIADQLNLLDWTLEQAIEHCAENIILTGDVFEEPKPHPSLIAMFISWLKKCQAYNIHVHIILGNHDMLRSGMVFTSSLDIIIEMDLDNVSVYKDINTFILGTSAFTIVPFRDRKSFSTTSNVDALDLLQNSISYELAGIPLTYKKVLVGHLAIEGSIPIGDEIDDMTNELFCPLNMFNGYNYVWMGHVHKPQIMQNGNVAKPHIAHIGSMDISNFGETDHYKHIVIINCEATENEPYFEIKYLPTRALKKISITVPKDTVDTTTYVLDEIKKNTSDFNKSIVKVEISLASSELKSVNKSEIEKYLTSQGVFNVAGVSESKKISLIKRDMSNTIDTKMDIITSIKTYAEAYLDKLEIPAFIELTMDIYKNFKEESKE